MTEGPAIGNPEAETRGRARLRALGRRGLRVLFPPRCLCCGAAVGSEDGLCGACWREAGFISAPVCALCGAPLPGASERAERLLCDECLRVPRPWESGRAALIYGGTGRRLILGLKHGDRLDLVRPLGDWLSRAAEPLIEPGMIVAPVPLHRLRLLKRRYNQSALLAARVARSAGGDYVPDLLRRTRATPSQEGLGREARFENLRDAMAVSPRRKQMLAGRGVLLIDDVMTSGATFAVATEALLAAGAAKVRVVALARVAEDA